MQEKPFSQSCENNKQPILDQLQLWFKDVDAVLEIGSGTGQHAVFFGRHLRHLQWQCSDRSEYHDGINQWLQEAKLPNVLPPVLFDVTGHWPDIVMNSAFSANTAHIMSWHAVEKMFGHIGREMPTAGRFLLYGPFNREGEYTSTGNAQFDQQLRDQDSEMGIRNDLEIFALASSAGLRLLSDQAMPANNRLLVWEKHP